MVLDEQIHSDFERARHRAFLQGILSVARRRPNQLMSYHEVRERLSGEGESYRGMQVVPVRQIIGSVDRFRDFNSAFLPLHNHTAGRWKSVDRAYHTDVRLPPIQLYKVGDVYFVKDGNHRVSVAREHGVDFIDAEVIETLVRVPLHASMRPFELLLQVEYAEFLGRTSLDQSRPDHDIRPTTLGRYDDIWDDILIHQEAMSEARGGPVPIEEAVTDWYDNVYCEIVSIARTTRVIERFPGRSEADVYLWVSAYRDAIDGESTDSDEPIESVAESVADLAAAVERSRSVGARSRRLLRWLGRLWGIKPEPPPFGP